MTSYFNSQLDRLDLLSLETDVTYREVIKCGTALKAQLKNLQEMAALHIKVEATLKKYEQSSKIPE